jgi:hypothetical protein
VIFIIISEYEPQSRNGSATFVRMNRDSLGIRQELDGVGVTPRTFSKPTTPSSLSTVGLNSLLYGESSHRISRLASASSRMSSNGGIKELLFGSYTPRQMQENERKRSELVKYYEEQRQERQIKEKIALQNREKVNSAS